MKRTTTWVFASPVRPHSCQSRPVQGPAGRAAGAQTPDFLAAQGVQPKRAPGMAGGGAGTRGRRPQSPLQLQALGRVILAIAGLGGSLAIAAEPPQQTPNDSGSTGGGWSEPSQAPAPALAEPTSGDAGSRGGDWSDLVPHPCVTADGALAPAMVVIPPGRFQMGSPPDEPGRDGDEGPQHWVTIPRPFAVGRCEVSVAEFRRFVRETRYVTEAERADAKGCYVWGLEKKDWEPRPGMHWQNLGFPQTDQHPAACVSPADAEAYLAWLSQRTGARYRLSTEAEWEYAARGGTATARFWGEDQEAKDQCRYANGADQQTRILATDWTIAPCDDGHLYTAPVASFAANPFGLYDTAGNVTEWTADCWHASYAGAPADGRAWLADQKGDCSRRVVRGGSWGSIPRFLRSAGRSRFRSVAAYDALGFRVARDL